MSRFSAIRPPRLSARTVARYAVARSARASGSGYSLGRALSLILVPWKGKKP